MKFNIYDRFQLEVRREHNAWAAYRLGEGTRTRDHDIAIPPELEARDIAVFLDDLFHELSRPGESIELLQ